MTGLYFEMVSWPSCAFSLSLSLCIYVCVCVSMCGNVSFDVFRLSVMLTPVPSVPLSHDIMHCCHGHTHTHGTHILMHACIHACMSKQPAVLLKIKGAQQTLS